jgi:hypothetical protein
MLRQLTRSVLVKAPSTFALAFVNTYFLERRAHTRGAELALRFPLPRFIVEGLTLEKRVMVHLDYERGGATNHALTIEWQPVGRGPLPSFDGNLTASPETEETCQLTIDGKYTPPGGTAGAAFDRVIGGRIANATISALLERFKVSIEADYAARVVP